MNKTLTILLILIVIVGGFFYFSQKDKDVLPTDEMEEIEIVYRDVEYGENSTGYLAEPVGDGPYPGLALIHEWWGLNDNIKELADDFAREGYVALAVDLYGGESTKDPKRAGELAGIVRENTDAALDNLEGAVEFLHRQANVDDSSLASVGWCFGGGWAYEMAKNDLGINASVMYYGQFGLDDDLSMMKAHILGHFGEGDKSIAVDDVREFEAKLKTLSGDHAVFIYPNAGHAFANEDNKGAYNVDAATEAWQRTLEFLGRELK